MATEYANVKLPVSDCYLYVNFADRNCFTSGSFTGRQLAGNLETINFQNQITYNTGSGGYLTLYAANRGINGSGSIAYSSAVSVPNQFTHIFVGKRSDVAYESQAHLTPLGTGNLSTIGFGGTSTFIGSGFMSVTSNVSITNSSDWFFIVGRNQITATVSTQSLFTRGFLSGTRVFEEKTANFDWSTSSGSATGISFPSNLTIADYGMFMSFTRPLSTSEINTIYDSVKYRYNLPIS